MTYDPVIMVYRPVSVRTLFLSCIAALAVATARTPAAQQKAEITIATWSGLYGAAQEAALFKPFTKETGIGVRIVRYDGDIRPVYGPGPSAWNVVDIERSALTTACADGKLERIDPELLLGKAAAADFFPGTLHPCGVGAMIWSQAVAYDATLFKGRPPRTLADFFDVKTFPGKRGLFSGAEGNLEIALMADGIPPEDVYDVLRNPGGVEQALAKLETIRADALFWHDGDEPAALLNEGRAVMSTAYAAHFLRPRQGARRPIGLMWTNQLWRTTFWAIPAGQADIAAAQRFVSFATDAERLADLSTRLWYGPARRSGLDAVPPNMRDDLPSARRHIHDGLQIDAGFWAEMGPQIDARFAQWRNSSP